MGCLNSDGRFAHWFGNIHLSGPCNRACYFCIGQHMMALDALNNLGTWPLLGLAAFLKQCALRGVETVYLTGTNTDPLLYRHPGRLAGALREAGFRVGIRTNGIAFHPQTWKLYDVGSVTICSLNRATSLAMMGGEPPDLPRILTHSGLMDLKVNVVLGPENRAEIPALLDTLEAYGVTRVNLREPYGQPRQGDPLMSGRFPRGQKLGMPVYDWRGMSVMYWDVHYVEVESVNLYANGRISETYPITKGCADDGIVQPQSAFPGGRIREQWVS
jgi:MoaA/NifB/PqqE/SkfB family radical SAM enzyme